MAKVKVLIEYVLSGTILREVDEDKLVAFETEDDTPLTVDDLENALGIVLDSHEMSDGVHDVEIVDIERVRPKRKKTA